MRALGEERVVITMRVTGEFTRIGHHTRLIDRLAALEQKINAKHRRTTGNELLHLGVGDAGLARVIQPDDHTAIPLLRIEPGDVEFLAVGHVGQHAGHFEMIATILLVLERPFDLARLVVSAANDGLNALAQDLRICIAQLLVGIFSQVFEQLALKLRIIRFRSRMFVIPYGELLFRERFVVLFDDGRRETELKVLVDEGVERRAGNRVVVVREVLPTQQEDVVLRAMRRVEFLQFRKALGGQFLGPVVRGVHSLRLGGKQSGELDVAGADAQQTGVFTGAAALHGRADHHAGKGELDAVVDGREQHRLRAAATRASDGSALWIDLGQRKQEVEATHGIPGLQAHDGLQMRLRLRAVEAPVFDRIGLRPLFGEAMHDFGRELDGI